MGVEPTAACSAQPATSFEDWGAHRDTTTPTTSLTHSPLFAQKSKDDNARPSQ